MHKSLWKHLFALLVCMATVEAIGAQTFRNLNISHGLTDNEAWMVEALPDRTLLVGTAAGFDIFDGVRFHHLGYPDGVLPVEVRSPLSVQRDADGNLWIKNDRHLLLFSQTQHGFVDVRATLAARGIEADSVANLFIDDDGDLWAFTKGGRLTVTDGQGATQEALVPPRSRIVCGIVQEANRVFILTSDGIFHIWDKTTRRIAATDKTFAGKPNAWTALHSCPYRGGHKLLYIDRSGGGLFLLSEGRFRPVADMPQLGTCRRIIEAGEDGYYVVCQNGIAHFDAALHLASTQTTLPCPTADFPAEPLVDATIDWQGGLWMANQQQGLFYTHPDQPRVERIVPSDLSREGVLFMTQTGPHAFFYGTSHGLYSFDTRTHQSRRITAISSDRFFSAYLDATTATATSPGTLWVGTRSGLFAVSVAYDGLDIHSVRHWHSAGTPALPSNRCLWAYPVADSRLFCCFGATQIGLFDTAASTFTPTVKPDWLRRIYRDFYYSHYDRQRGIVYAISTQGIAAFDLATGQCARPFREDTGFGQGSFTDFLTTDRGRLVAATSDGILIGSHSATEAPTQALRGSLVKALTEDGKHRLWMTTADGLASSTLEGTDSPSVSPMSLGEVLEGGEFVTDCMLAMGDSLWCGSTRGFVLVSQTDYSVPSVDSVQLVSVTTDSTLLLAPTGRVTLTHDQNFFTLHLSTCNYLSPVQRQFAYMLVGVDADWRTPTAEQNAHLMASGLRLSYTNLSPGTYRLRLRQMRADGTWSAPREWAIRIRPPFYRTWWAYLIYILLVAAAAYAALLLYRHRRAMTAKINEQERQLQERRNKFIVQAEVVKPEEIEITPEDKLFLERAVQLMHGHIGDSDYGVEQFATDMGVSRSSLYTSLQKAAGQTPAEFMRTIRMRRAEQLLRESRLTLKEIAYQCGYNDPRGFRKAFNDIYGRTPQEFRSQEG